MAVPIQVVYNLPDENAELPDSNFCIYKYTLITPVQMGYSVFHIRSQFHFHVLDI